MESCLEEGRMRRGEKVGMSGRRRVRKREESSAVVVEKQKPTCRRRRGKRVRSGVVGRLPRAMVVGMALLASIRSPADAREADATNEVCTSASLPSWTSEHGNLHMDGERFHLKGVSWFGFDTDLYVIEGLADGGNIAGYLEFLVENKFNALRVPISLEFALNPDTLTAPYTCGELDCTVQWPWVAKGWDVLHELFSRCREYGILIMLDMHSLTPNNYRNEWGWHDANYGADDFIDGWLAMIAEFKQYENFFAIDILNEPHDGDDDEIEGATWGDGDKDTDFKKFCEKVMKKVDDAHSDWKGLFMVEGVEEGAYSNLYDTFCEDDDTNDDDSSSASEEATCTELDYVKNMGYWWGGNLMGVYADPIEAHNDALQKRVVYAPHVHGPGVYNMTYFASDGDYGSFPDNMGKIWDITTGFVENKTGNALVIGEWGGVSALTPLDPRSRDLNGNGLSDQWEWSELLGDYLVDNCLSDTFWWCLNPTSEDTGGLLLDDWVTPDTHKLALMDSVQPNPSTFTFTAFGNTIRTTCMQPGEDANVNCRSYEKGVDEYWTDEYNSTRRNDPKYFISFDVEFTVEVGGLTIEESVEVAENEEVGEEIVDTVSSWCYTGCRCRRYSCWGWGSGYGSYWGYGYSRGYGYGRRRNRYSWYRRRMGIEEEGEEEGHMYMLDGDKFQYPGDDWEGWDEYEEETDEYDDQHGHQGVRLQNGRRQLQTNSSAADAVEFLNLTHLYNQTGSSNFTFNVTDNDYAQLRILLMARNENTSEGALLSTRMKSLTTLPMPGISTTSVVVNSATDNTPAGTTLTFDQVTAWTGYGPAPLWIKIVLPIVFFIVCLAVVARYFLVDAKRTLEGGQRGADNHLDLDHGDGKDEIPGDKDGYLAKFSRKILAKSKTAMNLQDHGGTNRHERRIVPGEDAESLAQLGQGKQKVTTIHGKRKTDEAGSNKRGSWFQRMPSTKADVGVEE